jgi:hypothetical protein
MTAPSQVCDRFPESQAGNQPVEGNDIATLGSAGEAAEVSIIKVDAHRRVDLLAPLVDGTADAHPPTASLA